MLTITVAELAERGEIDLGAGPWRRIDQDRVDTFADATDDHQWIHVDPERSKDGPFGTTIAHGYLTLSLLPSMLGEMLDLSDKTRGTNYGLEKVRFTSPVPVGSEIRMVAAIKNATRRDDGGVQFNLAVKIEIKGQERPAMIAESIYLYYADPVSE